MSNATDPVPPLTDAEIRMLRSILKLSVPEWRALKALASGVVRLGADNGNGAPAGGGNSGAPAVASDRELMGQYGDPTVRRDPRRWLGASYVSANYSQCPTDYLLVLAEQLEWSAEKDQEKGEAAGKNNRGEFWWKWNLKDAAKARGWAARNAGKVMPPPQSSDDGAVGDDGAAPPEDPADDDGNWTPS